jgi:hypothetical protein
MNIKVFTKIVLPIIFFIFFIIILEGCGRDTSTVEKAIIGHWVEKLDKGKAHYYISENQIIMLYKGEKTIMDYKILRSNEKKGFIEIDMINPDGDVYNEKLTFTNKNRTKIKAISRFKSSSKNYESYGNEFSKEISELVSSYLSTVELKSTWTYVDDATEP